VLPRVTCANLYFTVTGVFPGSNHLELFLEGIFGRCKTDTITMNGASPERKDGVICYAT
jgi:hypothetical protein